MLDSRDSSQLVHSAMESIDKPIALSNFDLRYRKFIEVVNVFLDRGNYFPKPNFALIKILKTKSLGSYAEFEDWITARPDNPNDLNFLHKAWLSDTEEIRGRFSAAEKDKIESWLDNFLTFERFKIIGPQVRFKL